MLKKQRTPEKEKRETYRIAVEGWEHRYSFGTNRLSTPESPYSEYCITDIKGSLITPALPEITKIELSINGDERLNQIDKDNPPPAAVGSIDTSKGSPVLSGYFFVPQRYMPVLIGLLLADKIKMIELYGFQLKRRKALIVDIEFSTQFRNDDE